MEAFDNLLEIYDECEFSVKRVKDMRFKKYLARICGEDSVFGYRRKFIRYHDSFTQHGNVLYRYGDLPDGVYETSVKYFREGDEKPTDVDRKICLIVDGDFYNYPYKALDHSTVLEYVSSIRDGTFDLYTAADSL